MEETEDKKLMGEEKPEELVSREMEFKKQVEELTEHLKRLQAEFENYKKRVAKEREETRRLASKDLVVKLLPFLDEFELSLKAFARSKDENHKGLKLLHENLLSILRREGLDEIKSLGEKFDPYAHEVANMEESDKEEGTVVGVIRKGYVLNGNVIRHALVSVAKMKETK
ncbi:nucleotide exchange factor GrpE [Candidatus Micrarchaeota archaeon]|nr:nucleotide exchange factor GrpE [Candidatus Micrarchaeota archaeon]